MKSTVQDGQSRLSLMTAQPLGGTSADTGQLEIMLDRRLTQDDNRGLFQGVQDNKVRTSRQGMRLSCVSIGLWIFVLFDQIKKVLLV